MKIPRIISGRAAILGLAFHCGEAARAESVGRIRMVGPSPSEEVVKTITKSLENACNSRYVIGVLGHCTPQRAAKVRRAVENAFICNDMELDVQEAILLSATDSEIVFGVRCGWHEKASPGPVCRLPRDRQEGGRLLVAGYGRNIESEANQLPIRQRIRGGCGSVEGADTLPGRPT